MHDKAMVHRDLKGKNILVDTNGLLKLADFGSAKQFESS
jgi:serine/threonine protein kinase